MAFRFGRLPVFGAAGAAAASATSYNTVFPDSATRIRLPPALHTPTAKGGKFEKTIEDADDSDGEPWMVVDESGEAENPFHVQPLSRHEIGQGIGSASAMVQQQFQRNDSMHIELPALNQPSFLSTNLEGSDDESDVLQLSTQSANRFMEAAEHDIQAAYGMPHDQFFGMVAVLVEDPNIQEAFMNNSEVQRMFAEMRMGVRVITPPATTALPGQLTIQQLEDALPLPAAAHEDDSPWRELEAELKAAWRGATHGLHKEFNKLADACRTAWARLTNHNHANETRPTTTAGVYVDEHVRVYLFVTASGEVQVLLDAAGPVITPPEPAEDDGQKIMEALIAFSIMVLAIILFKRYKTS